jgi:hypothetical protein
MAYAELAGLTPVYVNARVREALRGAPFETDALVLDAEGLTDVDRAGLDAIADLATGLGGQGIVLHVALGGHARIRAEAGAAELNDAGLRWKINAVDSGNGRGTAVTRRAPRDRAGSRRSTPA